MPSQQGVLDCGRDKVVLFSRDGNYAIGWTARDAKPEDWALWEKDLKEHTHEFVQRYDILDCAMDFQHGRVLPLPSESPYWPDKRRGTFEVFWSPTEIKPRYCLVQNQSRFATENLWLVRFDKSGIIQRDLVVPFGKAVRKLLREKMPFTADKYAISYPKSDWDDEFGYVPPEFHASSLDIPFTANLPKSGFDRVAGTITILLPEATIVRITSNTPNDDPLQSEPELAKADLELNDIYSALQKHLNGSERAALKKEQLDWLQQRNSEAGSGYPGFGSEPEDEAAYKQERNHRLLTATQQRGTELKQRMPR